MIVKVNDIYVKVEPDISIIIDAAIDAMKDSLKKTWPEMGKAELRQAAKNVMAAYLQQDI